MTPHPHTLVVELLTWSMAYKTDKITIWELRDKMLTLVQDHQKAVEGGAPRWLAAQKEMLEKLG